MYPVNHVLASRWACATRWQQMHQLLLYAHDVVMLLLLLLLSVALALLAA